MDFNKSNEAGDTAYLGCYTGQASELNIIEA